MEQPADWGRIRIVMAGVGAAGGAACYGLVELLPRMVENDRILLVLFLAVGGFFVELMSLAGPVSLRRAVLPSVAVAVGVALLMVWASFRFDGVDPFLEAGHPAAALFIIYLVATPFVSVRLEQGRGHWLDYAHLFQTAWSLIVRAIAAAVFTGVFWGVVFLSDALLDLVNIDVIEDILELDPMPFVITGAVSGLALAVAHEWREYVSPHLLLRLLRLLVPVVVPVLGLFIVAVGISGLDSTLGFFSETALLTGVAIGGITLVTVSVDRDQGHQVQARLMVWMVRALAVLLLPVALLAVWGVILRVQQYGWTPDRILAALSAVVVLVYALAYAGLVLWRGAWMQRLRRANVVLALLSLLLALLWLTPVLNAERIASNSQLSRILSGRVDADQAAIWELAHEWGRPGARAIYALRSAEDYPDQDKILVLLDRAAATDRRWKFEREPDQPTREDQARDLHARIPVFPQGQTLPQTAFADLSSFDIRHALSGCERSLPDGAPGCVFLFVRFRPAWSDPQGVMLFRTGQNWVEGAVYRLRDGRLEDMGELQDFTTGTPVSLDVQMIEAIRAGKYAIAPAQVNLLKLGEVAIFPDN